MTWAQERAAAEKARKLKMLGTVLAWMGALLAFLLVGSCLVELLYRAVCGEMGVLP